MTPQTANLLLTLGNVQDDAFVSKDDLRLSHIDPDLHRPPSTPTNLSRITARCLKKDGTGKNWGNESPRSQTQPLGHHVFPLVHAVSEGRSLRAATRSGGFSPGAFSVLVSRPGQDADRSWVRQTDLRHMRGETRVQTTLEYLTDQRRSGPDRHAESRSGQD